MINWIGLFVFTVCFAGLLSSNLTARTAQRFLSPRMLRVPLGIAGVAVGLAQLGLLPQAYAGAPSAVSSLISIISLWIHEAGHAAFSFDGEMLHVLGGTLLQLAVPLGAALYLALLRGYPAPGWLMLFWFGHTLADAAAYVADARARTLPLLGGAGIHDWSYLLSAWGMLERDIAIATMLKTLSGLVMAYSMALLFWFPGLRPTSEVCAHGSEEH